jgi:hypothetical protein
VFRITVSTSASFKGLKLPRCAESIGVDPCSDVASAVMEPGPGALLCITCNTDSEIELGLCGLGGDATLKQPFPSGNS